MLGTKPTDPAVLTGNRLVTQHNLLLVGPSLDATASAVRTASASLSNPPLAFAAANGPPASVSPLGQALPPQLALVSMQLLPSGLNLSGIFSPPVRGTGAEEESKAPPPASSGVLLVRLRHIHQAGLDAKADTVPVSVDLASVFSPRWKVVNVTEMVVDASESASDAQRKRVHWAGHSAQSLSLTKDLLSAATLRSDSRSASTTVTLQPMDLKTFVLTLAS